MITRIQAFTAYDCETHTERRRAISLLHPGLCQDPTEAFKAKKTIQAQVVQTYNGGLMHVYQCKVTQTRQVVRCGYDSITYTSEYTAWEQVRKLTSKQCQNAVEKGYLVLDKVTFLLQNNSVTTRTIYPFGSVSQGGHCAIESFPEAGRTFHRSFLRVHMKIEIKNRLVGVDEAQGTMILPNLGVRLETYRYYAHDGIHGTIFWKKKEESGDRCLKSMSGVYQGNVTLYQHKEGLPGSYVLVANNQTGQVAGLKIAGKRNICAKKCYSTQIPDLLLCDVDEFNVDPQGLHWRRLAIPFRPEFPQNQISLKSQLSYTSLSRTIDTNSQLEDIRDHLCEAERRILYNKLQAAAAGNHYAFLDQLGKGLQLYKAGAVIYAVECMEVDVLREEKYINCTEEIPVRYKNRTMFVEPITLTLQRYPTIIPCTATMPAQWFLGDRWYCSWPKIRPCRPPKEMQPATVRAKAEEDKKTTIDWLFGAGTDGQIYTKEDQRKHQQAMMIYTSSKPLLQDLARRLARPGQYDEEGHVQWGTPLTQEDMEKLYYSLGERYFLFFKWFGSAWLTFLGCYMTAVLLKVLLSCLTRMYVLYQTYGCGLWIICSTWNMLFLLLGVPAAVFKSVYSAATDAKRQWKDRNEEMGLLSPKKKQRRRRDSSSTSEDESPTRTTGTGFAFNVIERDIAEEREQPKQNRPRRANNETKRSGVESEDDSTEPESDCQNVSRIKKRAGKKVAYLSRSASEQSLHRMAIATSTTGLDGNMYPSLVIGEQRKAATLPAYRSGAGHMLPDQFFGTA